MGSFAVIDTETNWSDEVMSIGVTAADAETLRCIGSKYYVLTPEFRRGGMYEDALSLAPKEYSALCTREEAMAALAAWLRTLGVSRLFAYNACFDCGHLPELSFLPWYDIMRVAAYRQRNPRIPRTAECCSTGRLRRRYGVEPMLQLLTCDCGYRETHNALFDARDELRIMQLIGVPICAYDCARL